MIEYKELSAIPYALTIDVPPPKKDKNGWARPYAAAYTSQLYTTKRGMETLVISLFREKGPFNNKEWRLTERIFLNSSGEIAVEGYDVGKKKFVRGNFRIGNYGECGFEYYCSLSSDLLSQWQDPAIWSPDERLGEDFIKHHEILAQFKPGFKTRSVLQWAANYQYDKEMEREIRRDEERVRKTKALMESIPELPAAFEEWIFTEKLNKAPWLYSFDHKRVQKGFCGRCGESAERGGIKDGKTIECPHCGEKLRCVNTDSVKHYGSWSISGEFRIVQRRGENEYVTRKFKARLGYSLKNGRISKKRTVEERRRDIWSVKRDIQQITPYTVKLSSVFEPDGYGGWQKCKRLRYVSQTNQGEIFPVNINDIAQSLPFRHVPNMDLRPLTWWEGSVPLLLNRLQELPVIENMGKMGFRRLAEDHINGRTLSNVVSPGKFLGLDRPTLAAFAQGDASKMEIELWKRLDPSLQEMELFTELKNLCGGWLGAAIKVAEYGISLKKMVGYLKKQCSGFRSNGEMMSQWEDYLDMAEQLGLDPKKDKSLITPQDLKAEHDRVSGLVDIAKEERNRKGIVERAALLDKLSWEDEKYIIRPLGTLEDFVNESTVLNHCVKTYIKKCIDTEANIFGLRKKDSPDVPYYTVNISNDGTLIMNLGRNNRPAPPNVEKFVGKWLNHVKKKLMTVSLDPKKQEQNKIRVGA